MRLGFLAGALVSTALAQQGGDTIDTAPQITSLPFSASGTTIGFSNDYDETCPYAGSTSPDVVYWFRPVPDLRLNLSLCGSGTDFDTKLYVYEEQYTPGAPYACNDDACPNGRSQILDLFVSAGKTYYIVIDGYGGAAGNYTLDVTGVVEETCPAQSIVSQPIANPNAAVPSDQADGRLVADNFQHHQPNPAAVCKLRFWGTELWWTGSYWEECADSDPVFDITVYDSQQDGSAPDYTIPPRCMHTGVTAARTLTADTFAGHPIYRYDAVLSPCCGPLAPDTWYWIEIAGNGAPQDCWFLWLNQTTGAGDGRAYWKNGTPATLTYDLALCLSLGQLSPGDMNCDGAVNNLDIDGFVLALFDPDRYTSRYPNCDILNGDMNGDSVVNNLDINGFVSALFSP